MAGTKQALDKEALKLTKKCKWRLFVSNGFRADGKPNRATKTIGPCSAAQADKELQQFYLEFSRKPPLQSNKITFAKFIPIWTERHEKNLSPNTRSSGGRSAIESRLIPYFGSIRLSKLTADHIIDYFDKLRLDKERLDGHEGELSPGTIFDIYKQLRAILNKAVEWGYLNSNPCNDIPKDKRPKAIYRVKPILEDVELSKFLSILFSLKETATNVKYMLFFYLSLIDGCRSGEHLALTWDDINFTTKKLSISKDVYEIGGHTYIKNSTKNGEARIVYCDELCIELLQKHKVHQEAFLKKKGLTNPHNFIFIKRLCEGDGKVVVEPSGRSAVYHWLTAFLKRHGLPHIDVHTFRRMAASYSVNNQVALTTVQQMLGHKSLSTTMLYLRSLTTNRVDSVQTLSAAYQELMNDSSSDETDTTNNNT